ncbi:unnamed protein product [Penicillium glandicola]
MRLAVDPRAVGGNANLSHASAASALAHANRKPVEVWRPPTRQPAAEKAALCVKDYAPPQQPKPTTQHSAEGLGAAMLAVREQRGSVGQAPTSPTHRRGSSTDRYHHTAVGGNPKDKALKAASGAYTTSRKRADSAPNDTVTSELPYGGLVAGTSRPARVEEEGPLDHLDPAIEASRIQHASNTNPKLYTSSPPVQSETEEQNYRNSLRAAAVSMAKDMYKVPGTKEQSDQSSPAVLAAQRGQGQLGYRKTVSAADGSALRRAIALQEAAQKRAAERLALMQDENAEYQLYYGTAPQQHRSRLTTRRKRTSSDADSSQADAEQSRQIRSQMTSLRTKMDRVDVQRTRDRELLMQAARRNVDQTLQDMEARLYADTGRPPPSVQKGWDEVAQQRVRREAENFEAASAQGNRVNIGGQMYMDMADVDAVARSRLQPAFDEITDNAEQRRARDIEARLDAEEEQRHAAVEREREAEVKELEKQERGASKRNKSESKVPKFFLWRKKGKRARVEESESEEAQPVSPVVQGAVVEQAPTTGPDVNASTDTIPDPSLEPETAESIPEEASIETERADPAAVVVPISSVPETEPSIPDESDVPAAIPRRPTRNQTEPLEIEQRDAATSGPENVHHFVPPITSPRADTKLKTWFRDRLIRRSSGPVAIYPHQPGPDVNTDSEPAFQGGASLTGRSESCDEPRGAALSSHPLGGVGETIPTHNRSSSYYSNDFDVNNIDSVDSSPESTKQNGNGKRRSRIIRTFFKTASPSPDEPEPNDGDFRRDSGVPSFSKDIGGADKQSLRDSAVVQGLPVPPTISETANAKRESRFSEDL